MKKLLIITLTLLIFLLSSCLPEDNKIIINKITDIESTISSEIIKFEWDSNNSDSILDYQIRKNKNSWENIGKKNYFQWDLSVEESGDKTFEVRGLLENNYTNTIQWNFTYDKPENNTYIDDYEIIRILHIKNSLYFIIKNNTNSNYLLSTQDENGIYKIIEIRSDFDFTNFNYYSINLSSDKDIIVIYDKTSILKISINEDDYESTKIEGHTTNEEFGTPPIINNYQGYILYNNKQRNHIESFITEDFEKENKDFTFSRIEDKGKYLFLNENILYFSDNNYDESNNSNSLNLNRIFLDESNNTVKEKSLLIQSFKYAQKSDFIHFKTDGNYKYIGFIYKNKIDNRYYMGFIDKSDFSNFENGDIINEDNIKNVKIINTNENKSFLTPDYFFVDNSGIDSDLSLISIENENIYYYQIKFDKEDQNFYSIKDFKNEDVIYSDEKSVYINKKDNLMAFMNELFVWIVDFEDNFSTIKKINLPKDKAYNDFFIKNGKITLFSKNSYEVVEDSFFDNMIFESTNNDFVEFNYEPSFEIDSINRSSDKKSLNFNLFLNDPNFEHSSLKGLEIKGNYWFYISESTYREDIFNDLNFGINNIQISFEKELKYKVDLKIILSDILDKFYSLPYENIF